MAGLDPWYATFNDPASIVMAAFGDSITEGVVLATNGGWCEQVRVLADGRWPRRGDGLHLPMRNPWTMTSGGNTPTKATTSDAWDRGPLLGTFGTPAAATYRIDTAAKIMTWTKPGAMAPVKSFDLVVVDGASSNHFSYRVDGGAWTNTTAAAVTWTQANGIKRIRINTPVATTIEIRGANAAGTARNVYIIGVEPYQGQRGWRLHNVGAGAEYAFTAVRSTAGSWTDWLTLYAPKLVTMMFTNDVAFYDANFLVRLEAIADAAIAIGAGVVFMSFWEQPGRDVGDQASMRADIKTAAANKAMPYIDLYDLVGDNAATVAAGYLDPGQIHPTDAGHVFIAEQVWKLISKPLVGHKLVGV